MNTADTQTLQMLLEREEGDRDTAMIALRQADRRPLGPELHQARGRPPG